MLSQAIGVTGLLTEIDFQDAECLPPQLNDLDCLTSTATERGSLGADEN